MSENRTYQKESFVQSKKGWLQPVLVGASVLLVSLLSFTLFALSEPHTSRIVVDSFQLETSYKEAVSILPIPVQLVIPSINVNAEVQLVGLTGDGTGEMEVPDNFTDVGWYKYGPRPGMNGSAVIAGHLDGKNVPQAVFYDLSTLEIGDIVEVVDENGATLTFKVVKMRTYDRNAPTGDVFVSTDGTPKLNLITCGGMWLPGEKLYEQRTVVFTELVSTAN